MWGRFIGLLAGLALLAESYVLWRPDSIGALGAPELGPFTPYRSVVTILAAVAGVVVLMAALIRTREEMRAAWRAKHPPVVDWSAAEPETPAEPSAHAEAPAHDAFPPDSFVSAPEPEPMEALAPFPAADEAEPVRASASAPSAFAPPSDEPEGDHGDDTAPHTARAETPAPEPDANRGPFLTAMDDGDRLRDADRLDEALDSYSQALAFAQARHAAAPSDGLAACDLARAITSVGDIHDREGRLDSALDLHEQSLVIRRVQAAEAPDDLAVQRRLSLGLERLADTREARGHRSRARDLYRERLPLAQRLAAAAPGDAGLAQDLKTTRERLAELDQALSPPS